MALLILWEVDHGRQFPSVGEQSLSGTLAGFSWWLEAKMTKDPQLTWVSWREVQVPLCPGLAPTHHRRWSVRLVAPSAGEPQGWYQEFLRRWRAYLEVLAHPKGSHPMAGVTVEQVARVRPREDAWGFAEPMVTQTTEQGRGRRRGRSRDREEGHSSKRRRAAAPVTRNRLPKKRGREEEATEGRNRSMRRDAKQWQFESIDSRRG